MTIQELLAQVMKRIEFDEKRAMRKWTHSNGDNDGFQDWTNAKISSYGAKKQHTQDAKLIESLLEIIEEQHRALYVAQEQLYGVSIGISAQRQNINPHFYITEYLKYGDQAREAMASTLQKMKEIAK